MLRHRAALSALVVLLALSSFALLPGRSHAQQNEITVVASGLSNPRGFTWGSDGTLFVAEAGTGGTTARVAWIADGCPVTLAGGLPSSVDADGATLGAADVAVLDGTVYALIAGGGGAHDHPETAAGVYAVRGDGSVELVADLGVWMREHPVANVPEEGYDREGVYRDLAVEIGGPEGDALLIVEGNSQQLLRVTPTGEISRVADLSTEGQHPVAVAVSPSDTGDGGLIYVGFGGEGSAAEGAASVVSIDADGEVTTVWTGLSAISGVAVAEDGTLLASESTTGVIVRQTGPVESTEMVTGLDQPAYLAVGPDGALYVASSPSGAILRIETDGAAATPIAAGALDLTASDCGGATAVASPAAEGEAAEVAVSIYDFGFDPPLLTIPVGTTVTWTNDGAVQHTTVAFDGGDKIWDSDIMESGDVYSYTFTEAGTFDYLCGLHPNMTATIEVTD